MTIFDPKMRCEMWRIAWMKNTRHFFCISSYTCLFGGHTQSCSGITFDYILGSFLAVCLRTYVVHGTNQGKFQFIVLSGSNLTSLCQTILYFFSDSIAFLLFDNIQIELRGTLIWHLIHFKSKVIHWSDLLRISSIIICSCYFPF